MLVTIKRKETPLENFLAHKQKSTPQRHDTEPWHLMAIFRPSKLTEKDLAMKVEIQSSLENVCNKMVVAAEDLHAF